MTLLESRTEVVACLPAPFGLETRESEKLLKRMADPREVLCAAGWHRDTLRSAHDAPCVVTTAWLSLAVGLVTVANGLWAVGQAVIVAMLR